MTNKECCSKSSGSNVTYKMSELTMWKYIATIGIVAAIVFGYLYFSEGSSGKVLTEEEISERVLQLVEDSTTGQETLTVGGIKEEYGLYLITVNLETEDGPVEQEVRMSKDGELLVIQSVPYADILAQIEAVKQQQVDAAAPIEGSEDTEEVIDEESNEVTEVLPEDTADSE